MKPETITAIAGALLSLAFSYIPGLRERYEALDGLEKRLVMLVLLLATTLVVAIIACAGLAPDFGIDVACDRAGIIGLVEAFFAALVTNQATYLMTPRRGEA